MVDAVDAQSAMNGVLFLACKYLKSIGEMGI